MYRSSTNDRASPLHLTFDELEAIPFGRPVMLSEQPIGTKWREREKSTSRIVIRRLLWRAHDGPILITYRPVIRVPAVSQQRS